MTRIDIRVDERLCGNCRHGYIGIDGVYCRLFDQLITREEVAAECPQYEPW